MTSKKQASSNGAAAAQVVPDFRVAIDFGTTFTSIAFVRGNGSEVLTVAQFPGDDDMGRNHNQKSKAKNLVKSEVLYGYEVTRYLEIPDNDPLRTAFKNTGHVSKPKLLLDDSERLEEMRNDLMAVLNQLKSDQLIQKNEDVIVRLIECFLQHTRMVLERDHNLSASRKVEVTLAVPVCWTAGANAVMSSCLETAMKNTKFGTDGTTPPLLFMVNEAEAAALNALHSEQAKLARSEVFILLDCGGGTTDVGTYKISATKPLRLEEEVCHPQGPVCGSGDLNGRMRQFAIHHLRNELYLEEAEGMTIANIVEAEIMPKFEGVVKRIFSLTATDRVHYFRIRGLRESCTNPVLKQNNFALGFGDLKALFDESLLTIDGLMLGQIENAKAKNTRIKKVVLVGGFGDSPALKEHLQASLTALNNKSQTPIMLVVAPPSKSATGVAIGAVKRAHDKINGPMRIPNRSIGVRRHIPWDADAYSEEVLKQRCTLTEISQEEYIMDTILWVIKANQGELKAIHEYEFVSEYPFSPDDSKWIAEEELFVSDTCVEDFFARSHKKNRGKTTRFGLVKFDVTHLRDNITMIVPPEGDEGSARYDVTIRVTMQVIDRHLEFTAYWPADDKNAAAIQGSQMAFDITSAFKPGTA